MITEGPGYAYEIDYGPEPEQLFLSQARDLLRLAEIDAAQARAALEWAEQVVAQRQYELRYAVCDHPDRTGYVCDDCHQYAEPTEDVLTEDAYWRDRLADQDDMPDTYEGARYSVWIRRRLRRLAWDRIFA